MPRFYLNKERLNPAPLKFEAEFHSGPLSCL